MIILAVCVDGENTVKDVSKLLKFGNDNLNFFIFSVLIGSGMTCGQRHQGS